MKKRRKFFPCMDCGYETSGGVDGDEWYSVHDDIWIKACGYIEGKLPGSGLARQILCIGCLERRLDRPLTPDDFTDAPVNKPDDGRMSYRLLKRLGFWDSRCERLHASIQGPREAMEPAYENLRSHAKPQSGTRG